MSNLKRFNTPILFLVFNRLDTTKIVLEKLKKVQPKKIYIASDGYRLHIDGEKETVSKIRKYILNTIDWDCEIKTLFREKNLGCKYAVSGAISWFFSKEERGIVLEDDIVPSENFFIFCEDMLEKYKNNKFIGSISGRNELGELNIDGDYYFSNKFFCWGWASWSDRILDNNVEFANTTKVFNYKHNKLNFKERLLVRGMIGLIASKQVNSWAYPYDLSFRVKKQLCLIPAKNMVKNIGLDIVGAHSSGKNSDRVKYFKNFLPKFDKNKKIVVNSFFMNSFIDMRYKNIFYLYMYSQIRYLGWLRKIINKLRN